MGCVLFLAIIVGKVYLWYFECQQVPLLCIFSYSCGCSHSCYPHISPLASVIDLVRAQLTSLHSQHLWDEEHEDNGWARAKTKIRSETISCAESVVEVCSLVEEH